MTRCNQMEMDSHQKIKKKIAFEHFVSCPIHFLVSFKLRNGNDIFHYIKYLNFSSALSNVIVYFVCEGALSMRSMLADRGNPLVTRFDSSCRTVRHSKHSYLTQHWVNALVNWSGCDIMNFKV